MAQKYDVVLAPVGVPDVVMHQRFTAKTDAFADCSPRSPVGGICFARFVYSASRPLPNACRKQPNFLFYRSLD
jgi:hypothetical protein